MEKDERLLWRGPGSLCGPHPGEGRTGLGNPSTRSTVPTAASLGPINRTSVGGPLAAHVLWP